MGAPGNADTQGEKLDVAANKEDLNKQSAIDYVSIDLNSDESKAFEAAVVEAVKTMQKDANGRYMLPKDLPAEVKHAAMIEKRRRDTQSEFTKIAQAKKVLEVENAALKNKATSSVTIKLTAEQAEELEDLKFSDPEAWRKKVNFYENESFTKQKKELDDEIATVSAEYLAKDELERRKEVLKQFNQEHPDFQLDDELLQNEIPPRITKSLETGQVTFEAFLQEVYDYTKTGKVVRQERLESQPNLSKIGGGSKADKMTKKEDLLQSYKKEVF
jgi:hypothetical protein